jgi:hypothetical protein
MEHIIVVMLAIIVAEREGGAEEVPNIELTQDEFDELCRSKNTMKALEHLTTLPLAEKS